MKIEAPLAAHLKADPKIPIGNRVYRGIAPPQAVLPRIVFVRIGGEPSRHQTGASGLVDARIQLDCWADDPQEASEIAETVETSLDHLTDQTFGTSGELIFIHSIVVEDTFEDQESLSDSSGKAIYRTGMMLRIWYKTE
jgi:hypothetical protein